MFHKKNIFMNVCIMYRYVWYINVLLNITRCKHTTCAASRVHIIYYICILNICARRLVKSKKNYALVINICSAYTTNNSYQLSKILLLIRYERRKKRLRGIFEKMSIYDSCFITIIFKLSVFLTDIWGKVWNFKQLRPSPLSFSLIINISNLVFAWYSNRLDVVHVLIG